MIYVYNFILLYKNIGKRKKLSIKNYLDRASSFPVSLVVPEGKEAQEQRKNLLLTHSTPLHPFGERSKKEEEKGKKRALAFSSLLTPYSFGAERRGAQTRREKGEKEEAIPLGLLSKSGIASSFRHQKEKEKDSLYKNFNINKEKGKKSFYTSYSKLSEVKLLTIGIASPLRILQWAEKTLPNGKIYGEVLNANTLHHKTFKPQKGGLFCERIFGPLKDFECACGKVDKSVKKIERDSKLSEKKDKETTKIIRKFCPDCDVEYTWSVIRRYQLGYIKLSSPVTHIWFLKGTPSYLSLLLDMKKRYLQFVTYCSETLTIEKSSLPFHWSKDSFFSFNKDKDLVKAGSKNFSKLSPPIGTVTKFKKKSSLFAKEKATPIPKKGWVASSPFANQHNVENLTGSYLHLNKEAIKLGKKDSYFSLTEQKVFTNKTNLPFVLRSLKNRNIKSNRKGTSVLSTLLLSIYYKSLKNRNNKDKKILLPTLKTLFKKLPLDLYILCSLERMLHKSSINLSIRKAWEIIYKKAFVKAAYKANNILTKFVNLSSFPNSYLNSSFNSSLNSSYNNSYNEKNKVINILNKKSNDSLKNSKTVILNNLQFIKKNSNATQLNGNEKIALKKATFINKHLENTLNRNGIIFKNLKNKYSSHVLKLLENLRYPVLSLNYTTIFVEKNSLFQLQKKITLEMVNYFLKNEEYLENILSSLLLNSLLLDSFINLPLFVPCARGDEAIPILKKRTSFLLLNGNGNNNKEQKEKIKSMTIINTLKKYLELNKRKSFSIKRSFKNKLGLTYKEIFSSNTFNSNFSKEIKERETLISITEEKDKLTFKKKIYNNVYTLSHRERWDIDKDWYIFSLFTFGITEYTDYPIYTYKDRLSSLITSRDYSYFSESGFENKDALAFDFKNHLTLGSLLPAYSARALQLQRNKEKGVSEGVSVTPLRSLKGNVGIDWSFIYSSVFYSGAGIVQQLVNELNLNEIKKLDKQNRLLLYQLNKLILNLKKFIQIFIYEKEAKLELKELCKKRDLLIRRTKLVRKMFRKNTNPGSMILNVIPVLPPDLRPIVKMGNQIAASDLNRLYQRVIYRNDRLKKFLKDPATSQSYEMKYAQRLLQEAVDNLMQNGKSGPNSEKDARGRLLKSLSDSLKGKQGRFRQFLLGKRVDYSGRSVIVVGPKLKLHECGLPVEMAKELYLPFLLKSILNKNYAKTVIGAKTLIKNNPSLANELLREIMQVTPVLLNRAPTLHRLGFQAFVPKLIEGRAILLHPLVCSAFNADFDGDQMAVHVPITVEARAEAWKIMLSRNNLLSPATGDPLAIPSQDMVLGCYYLTTFANLNKRQFLRGSGMYFNHLYDVIKFYDQQLIDIHALVWVKWTHLIENGRDKESPIEIRITPFGQWQEISSNYQKTYDSQHNLINLYMRTTPGRIFFNLLIQQIMYF